MRNVIFILVLLPSIFFAGCTGVVTEEPIGTVLNIREETQKAGSELEGVVLDGAWNGGDDIIYSKLLKDGETLKIAGLRWDPKIEEFSLWSEEIVFSELDGNAYVNQKVKNGSGYNIASVGSSAMEAEGLMDILISYPDSKEFKKALREMNMLGETEDPIEKEGNIYIENSKEEVDNLIKEYRYKLFEFDTPKVYRKIPWIKN